MKIKDALTIYLSGFMLIAIIVLQQSTVHADILVLKNGKQIKADTIWEDEDLVKYEKLGSTVGYPKENVGKIIRENNSKAGQVIPVPTAQVSNKKTTNPIVLSTAKNKKPSSGIDLTPAIKVMLLPLFGIFVIIVGFNILKLIFATMFFRSSLKRIRKKPRLAPFIYEFFTKQVDGIHKSYSYERIPGLFTNTEKAFLYVLKEAVGNRYLIQGKVRLADIIEPENSLSRRQSLWAFRKISQKHIDFVLCDKDDYTILGVIELDDKSHNRLDRIARDQFVDKALSQAGLPILHYPVKNKYSTSELQESIKKALDLDFKWATSLRSCKGPLTAAENENRKFVDKDEDSRWAPPEFKM